MTGVGVEVLKGLSKSTLRFLAFWIVAFQRCNHLKNSVRHTCVTWNISGGVMSLAFACMLVLQIFETSGSVVCYFALVIGHECCDNRVLHQKGVVRTWIWPKFVFIFCTFCEKAASNLSQFGVCAPEYSAVPQANNLVVPPVDFPGQFLRFTAPAPRALLLHSCVNLGI